MNDEYQDRARTRPETADCYHLLVINYYVDVLTSYYVLLTTYYLQLTTCYLLLATYHLLYTTYHLPFTTYHLPLTLIPLTTHCNVPLLLLVLLLLYTPTGVLRSGERDRVLIARDDERQWPRILMARGDEGR